MQRVADLPPVLERLDPSGSFSFNALARKLTVEGVPTPGDRTAWTAATVAHLGQRLRAL